MKNNYNAIEFWAKIDVPFTQSKKWHRCWDTPQDGLNSLCGSIFRHREPYDNDCDRPEISQICKRCLKAMGGKP